jgi:MFS family permease
MKAAEPAVALAVEAKPAKGKLRRKVPAAVVAFGTVSLLTDLASEAVNAILPLYVTAVLGLGPLAYGFIDGIYQGASAAVRILGGWWSDVSRRPKWVSFLGYATSAVSKVMLLFAGGFAGIASAVTVDRLGKGLRTGPRDALIANASTPKDMGKNFGVHRTMDTLGALIGPLVAFAILAAIPWGAGGYTTIFVISAAVSALGLVVLVVMVPDLRSARRNQPKKKWGRWADLRTPRMIRLYVMAGLLGLGTIGDGFIYLTLSQGDALAARYFPLLFVGTNLTFMALSVPLGKLADRIGRGTVFVGGHLALLVMYVLLIRGNQGAWWVVAVLALSGAYYAATDGVIAALTAQVVRPQSRASGISATQTVVALARFGSSIGFGIMWQFYGSTVAVTVMSALLAVALAAAAVLIRPWLRRVPTR